MAVVKAAPIAIIRPMIGATEAVSRTLLGVTNQLDPNQLHDIEEVRNSFEIWFSSENYTNFIKQKYRSQNGSTPEPSTDE